MEIKMSLYPHGSDTPTATACIEGSKLGRFYESLLELLEVSEESSDRVKRNIDRIDKRYGVTEPLDPTPKGKLVIEYGAEKNEKELFFVEADAVFIMLYTYSLESAKDMKLTFDCKGEKYTDISDITVYSSESYNWLDDGETEDILFGCSFSAKKGDNAKTGYALINKMPFFDPENVTDDEWKYSITPIASHGIYETGSILQFVVEKAHEKSYTSEEWVSFEDAFGNIREEKLEDEICIIDSFRFFEKNGSDFRFVVMENGVITREEITKTDKAITFYSNSEDNPGEVEIEFKYVNGKYIYGEYEFNEGFKGENFVFNIPELDEREYSYYDGGSQTFTAEQLYKFYKDLQTARFAVFMNAEKYSIPEVVLYSGEDNLSDVETLSGKNLVLERVGEEKGKYTFEYDGVKITASLSGKVETSYDSGIVFEPVINVESLLFKNKGVGVELSIPDNGIYVRISRGESELLKKSPLDVLRIKQDFIDNSGDLEIPSNLHFETDFVKFAHDGEAGLELCKKISEVIFKMNLDLLYDEEELENEVRRILSEDGKTPPESVIRSAIALKKEYIRTGKIPNLVILGQAGTGKSTLAGKLAKVFGRTANIQGPSNLKPAFLGQTQGRVAQKLIQTAVDEQVLFVDEAYELMKDEYGREAMAILLPIMSGEKDFVETNGSLQDSAERVYFGDPNDEKNKPRKVILDKNTGEPTKTIEMHFTPGNVPIWFAGYENDVREMVSENQGLYRRLRKIIIPTPATSQLVGEFKELLASSKAPHADELRAYFEEKGYDAVEKFFGWGAQVQNSKYFGSHGGVINFFGECLDSIDFKEELGTQIADIIRRNKMDIKRQLAALRNRGNNDADSINVITDIKTRFKDLVGCDSEVTYMKSIIDMLVNKAIYEDYNLTVPKGALMEGLPGTGKTFIASAMAGELQDRFEREAPDLRFGFMSFSASELGNKPLSFISSIFNTAEEYDACIMFIDEVDAIAKNRNENQFHDRYLELIKQMDGVEKRSNVFILAATNAPDQLDPAFVRSGRIDKSLKFTLPDGEALKELARRAVKKRLAVLANKNKTDNFEEDIDLIAGLVAKRTGGFTAGDIDNIINNAYIAYYQFKNFKKKTLPNNFFKDYPFVKGSSDDEGAVVELTLELPKPAKNVAAPKHRAMRELYAFIDEEIERKMVGTVNYALNDEEFHTDVNDESRSSTAVHEVGHALVSLIQGDKPFNTITILSRGRALGYVTPAETRLLTKADFKNNIRVSMGGRIAEELFYGKDNISVGAKKDMLDATRTARNMVERYGFSEEFGFMALATVTDEYLGGSKVYLCSEEGKAKIDEAVNKLLKELYAETLVMLSQNKSVIETLAKTVFEKKSMTGDEFKRLWEQLAKKK